MIKNKERRASVALAVYTSLIIIILALLLFVAALSIDRADREIKSSPSYPNELVSLGTPRSRLELERFFSMMSREYSDSEGKVCEPITKEYLSSVQNRINNGEILTLSVEEVLYIIADSASSYDNYDVIKLATSDGYKSIYPCREPARENLPFHQASRTRLLDILEIITYRILSLSSPEAVLESEDGYVYTPKYNEREVGESRSFVISKPESACYSNGISFIADGNREILLYPTAKIAESLKATVLCESGFEFSEDEKNIIISSGYSISSCRNVTPDYWYQSSPARLCVVGGRILLMDKDTGTIFEALPHTHRFGSAAVGDTDGDKKDEIFFTSLTENGGSALWKYEIGGELELLREEKNGALAVYRYENEIALYKAQMKESKKYITMLVSDAEKLWSEQIN